MPPDASRPFLVSKAVRLFGPELQRCRSPAPSHWSILRYLFPAVNTSHPTGGIFSRALWVACRYSTLEWENEIVNPSKHHRGETFRKGANAAAFYYTAWHIISSLVLSWNRDKHEPWTVFSSPCFARVCYQGITSQLHLLCHYSSWLVMFRPLVAAQRSAGVGTEASVKKRQI